MRLPPWILVPIACTLLALFFASGGANLRNSLVQWYVWGALAFPIVWVDRLLPIRRDALGLRAAVHVPLSLVWTFIYIVVAQAVQLTLDGKPLMMLVQNPLMRGAIHWNIIYYWLIVGGYFAIDNHRHWRERERRATELERALVEAQLSALRTQLHPHFLFNALNTISAEVERQPKVARRMLEHLGELLRLSLESARPDQVTLTDELEMLEHFLAIQRTRFAGRLDIRLEIDPAARGGLVPGLLLQPLVENAIRHGIAPRVQPGRLRIAARAAQGRLHLQVEDDGLGLPPGWTLGQHAGIGLSNTRRRLEAQYGSQHTFTVRPVTTGGVAVEVVIPLETARAGAATTAAPAAPAAQAWQESSAR